MAPVPWPSATMTPNTNRVRVDMSRLHSRCGCGQSSAGLRRRQRVVLGAQRDQLGGGVVVAGGASDAEAAFDDVLVDLEIAVLGGAQGIDDIADQPDVVRRVDRLAKL